MASAWPSRRTNTPGGGGLKRLTGSLQTSTLPLFSPSYWYNQLASLGDADTPPVSLTSSEAGTSQGSTESALSSQLSEITEPDPAPFASSEGVAQEAATYGCDKPGLEVEAESQVLYRFNSTLYVARSRFVKMDAEVSSLWQKEVKPRLQTDLRPVMERIRAKSCSKPLQESAVFLDLRMSGRLDKGASRRVRLFPTIWILCGSKWCKKMICGVMKDLAWLSFFDLGIEIHQGPPLPAATDEVEVSDVLSVDPDSFVTLTNGEKLWVHVQSPEPYGSCNGLLCCCTTEKTGEYRQVLSKIGGAVTSENRGSFGATTAHGLFSICTPVVQDVDSSSASESDSFSDSESLSSLESDDTSIHNEILQQTTVQDQDPILGQIHITQNMTWHNVSEGLSAYFLHESLASKADSTSVSKPGHKDGKDGIHRTPDFALVRPEKSKAFRNIIPIDAHDSYQQSNPFDSDTGCKLVLNSRETLEACMISGDVSYYLGGNEIAVKKVELPGRLAAGNSGSWIFDNSNQLSGMVLANSSIEPFALAITSEKLYADISGACPELGHMSVELSTLPREPRTVATHTKERPATSPKFSQVDDQVDGPSHPAPSQPSPECLGFGLVEMGQALRTGGVDDRFGSSDDVSNHATAADPTFLEVEQIQARRLALEAELLEMRKQEDQWKKTHEDLSLDLNLTKSHLEEAEKTSKREAQRGREWEAMNLNLRREVAGLHKSITATALENDMLREEIVAIEEQKTTLQKKKTIRKTSDQAVATRSTSSASHTASFAPKRWKMESDSGYESMPVPIAAFSSPPAPWTPYQYPSPPGLPRSGTLGALQPQRRRSVSELPNEVRNLDDTQRDTRSVVSRMPSPALPTARMPPPPPPLPPSSRFLRPASYYGNTLPPRVPRPNSYYGDTRPQRRTSVSNMRDVVTEVGRSQGSEDTRDRRDFPTPYAWSAAGLPYPPPPPTIPRAVTYRRPATYSDIQPRRHNSVDDIRGAVSEVGRSQATRDTRSQRPPTYYPPPQPHDWDTAQVPPPLRPLRKSVVFDDDLKPRKRRSAISLNELYSSLEPETKEAKSPLPAQISETMPAPQSLSEYQRPLQSDLIARGIPSSSTETLPLTAEALRQFTRKYHHNKSRTNPVVHQESSRSSTRGTIKTSSSRATRTSATTAATSLSGIGDEDITIRVSGTGVLQVGGAEIAYKDGEEINISQVGASGVVDEEDAIRPDDDRVVDEMFLDMMWRRGWNHLPDQARRQMLAYTPAKKWTLINQDRLSQSRRPAVRRIVRAPRTATDGDNVVEARVMIDEHSNDYMKKVSDRGLDDMKYK